MWFHAVLIRISSGYPPDKGRLHTRYAPVRHSHRTEALIPFDLHVLGLPLAFILSQDQTLHCKMLFDTNLMLIYNLLICSGYQLQHLLVLFYTTCYLLKNFSGAPRGLPNISISFFCLGLSGCEPRAANFLLLAIGVILLFYSSSNCSQIIFPFCWECKDRINFIFCKILFFFYFRRRFWAFSNWLLAYDCSWRLAMANGFLLLCASFIKFYFCIPCVCGVQRCDFFISFPNVFFNSFLWLDCVGVMGGGLWAAGNGRWATGFGQAASGGG